MYTVVIYDALRRCFLLFAIMITKDHDIKQSSFSNDLQYSVLILA